MYLIFSSLLYTQCIHDFNNNDFFPLVIEAMKIVQNSVCIHEITITNLANFITSLRSKEFGETFVACSCHYENVL